VSDGVTVSLCGGHGHEPGLAGCCAHAPVLIAPSMLSCDFAEMAKEAQRMVDAGSDWLHLDVMVRKKKNTSFFHFLLTSFYRMVILLTISQWDLLFVSSMFLFFYVIF
jgi:hypothetical protein